MASSTVIPEEKGTKELYRFFDSIFLVKLVFLESNTNTFHNLPTIVLFELHVKKGDSTVIGF